jgi:hypothetical protein
MTFDAWVARARSVPIERVLERHQISLQRNGHERVGPCPKCGGTDRFAINTNKQVFNCRKCGACGDVIDLERFLNGGDFNAACETLTGEPPPKKRSTARKVFVEQYDYDDAAGVLLYVVERFEFQNPDGTFVLKDGKRKKTFKQKRPDPQNLGRWIYNLDGVERIPYRLSELLEAIGLGQTILIPEGERCVDALRAIGVPASCNSEGAGKWRPELNQHLVGADVVLLPDNDDPGWDHINKIGAALTGVARRIRVLVLPELPSGGDVTDWLAGGGTRERLDELVAQAPDWQAPAANNLEEEKAKAEASENTLIEALAKMRPGVEFARQRKKAARELGVSQDAIDDELEARRGEREIAPLYGHWIVEPWPEPVEGDSLLRDIIRRIRRHVVCSHEDALAVALWIMFAWVHDEVAIHSPILLVTSAEAESGKSTKLGLIFFLLPRCVSSVEISEAALYRAIELWQPSFVIDEFDSVLAGDEKVGLRSVINSGHTRGQGVVRCIEPDFTPKMFKTFAPKAIGMVGRKLPATTLGRCIIVELRRRKVSEPIERFTHKDDAELGQLRSRLARWAADNEDVLRDAKPSMPEDFGNRRADNWRVQFAIADLAGEDWGEKARLAAAELEGASDATSIGVQLLADIRRIRDEEVGLGRHCILSAKLVERLNEDAESLWAAWGKGKGLTQNSLAVFLSGGGGRGRSSRGGFGIRSNTVHPSRKVQGKGYKWSQFDDAFARYLPPEQSPDEPPDQLSGEHASPAPPPTTPDSGASDGLPPDARVLGNAPGQRCVRCGSGRDVYLIRRREGEEADPWHKKCAAESWARDGQYPPPPPTGGQ